MSHTMVDGARMLGFELRDRAEEHEEARRVSPQTSLRMAQEGFYRMLVPEAVGGFEVHPAVFAEVLEGLARGDAATAWVVMTGATTGVMLAWLDPDVARSMLEEEPETAFAGVFAPMGKAVPAEGGFRLTGRWPYGSGCENAYWRLGGAVVDGTVRSFFFRADDSEVHDTWSVSGLQGTGSHDISVDDLFVPAEHTAAILVDPPRHDGRLYKFPVFGLLATGVGAVALGIARAALDDAKELATSKRTRGGSKQMAESELVQVRLAEAEGKLRAARALTYETLWTVWQRAEHEPVTDEQRAAIRLAATHAARTSSEVVRAVCDLVGGAGIRKSSRFQRYRRDMDVLTTHIMVGEQTLKPVGRILLGLETDTSAL